MTDRAPKNRRSPRNWVSSVTRSPTFHRVVELIQAGAIGTVTEVHSWIGGNRECPRCPPTVPTSPPTWTGISGRARSPHPPYHSTYCPHGWRFWWDYGTGETGNWGCHILDIPFLGPGSRLPDTCLGLGTAGPLADDSQIDGDSHEVPLQR
ncbi:MAG: hypothetical protein Ct9H300mP1_14400 [Planctomycetaceae bacterium]|nr:MAG: hypothetical protein Ct9H300mP1_14400 [Planctomycetaceae bacterium]